MGTGLFLGQNWIERLYIRIPGLGLICVVSYLVVPCIVKINSTHG